MRDLECSSPQQLEDTKRRAPRPLRSASKPWGLSQLTMRELKQLTTGSHSMINNLYLETLVILKGGGSMMEHPAPPTVEEYVSVWRLRLQQMVSAALHNACQVLIQQWRYGGAAGVKPTTIRCIDLGQHELHSAAIPGLVRPPVVLAGYDDTTKSFRTAAAKEYPEGLCCALVRSALPCISKR